MRRAKIVCTLGPSSSTPEVIEGLIELGMDCARLNFSHGEHEIHLKSAQMIREASAKKGRPVAILADLSGPKMRVGRFENGSVELKEGARFTLTTAKVMGDVNRVSHTYDPLGKDVSVGEHILLDDGLLNLRVLSKTEQEVVTEVVVGGTLSDRKGMNIPGSKLSAPALTEKDMVDLKFAVDVIKVDYLALSFVRKADDVKLAVALAKGTPVIAKIEKPEGVENLEEILDACDGAMVARGDLGVEVNAEKVPMIQKRIIREVNKRGKIVITATQMLDSMIRNPRPTRAEAADVANAVLDGTDAVMLSGETASGKYPREAISMMAAIIREVETDVLKRERGAERLPALSGEWAFTEGAARAAARMSYLLPLKAIVTFTRDGRTARLLAEARPRAPIVAITSTPHVATRLALEWGVIPRLEIPPEDLEETLRLSISLLTREKICSKGDEFAMVFGWPPSGGSNTIKLHKI